LFEELIWFCYVFAFLSFQPYSFDRFYSVKRETPDSGLGLPIIEGMVKMYGGNITAENELGKGAAFKNQHSAGLDYRR
jgi:K+-sensing histidine kinase KdpD